MDQKNVLKMNEFFTHQCPSVLMTENLGNVLLVGRDLSRFTKYYSKMPTGYQALKGSHIKGSSMESTSKKYYPMMWEMLDTGKTN